MYFTNRSTRLDSHRRRTVIHAQNRWGGVSPFQNLEPRSPPCEWDEGVGGVPGNEDDTISLALTHRQDSRIGGRRHSSTDYFGVTGRIPVV